MTVAVVLACDGLAATSCFAEDVVVVRPAHDGRRSTASEIRTEIRRPYDHPAYTVELEPHFVMQWTDLPFRTDVGVGLGFRASIPVLDPGPIPRFNKRTKPLTQRWTVSSPVTNAGLKQHGMSLLDGINCVI